ncbi:Uncharacterized membrane protein HdeD, DUF308 family [Paracoccus isoporae]|uniref:Uncharacterized membrane protein HdeD, DUF308 family n=1 Tax=Paracoccus isoporae TaxID=591205 RepID=A0A1G6UP42_9RHOB|nr:DUF308 domain-containing protein [Paracoccus isoporae]SDD43061.1 Uncharacterized membrane protein HdeD, DUF308 family [Paracoccus isoporae]
MTGRILWIVIGILSVLAGILALANPFMATLTAERFAGWSFIFIGGLQIGAAFQTVGWAGRIWVILLGLACILLGVFLLLNPLAGIVSLTFAAAVTFIIAGIFKIVLAMDLRGTPAFWLMMLSGLVSVVLGAMVLGNFPASAATLLGILLAVELISTGVSMVALSTTREATRH